MFICVSSMGGPTDASRGCTALNPSGSRAALEAALAPAFRFTKKPERFIDDIGATSAASA